MKQALLVVVGAAGGGLLGYLGFFWLVDQGLYGMILPGALLGLGAGIARNRSALLAVACGIATVGLGLYTEWRFAPFRDDESFGYFLAHVFELKPITLIMIGVGGLIAFYVPFRRGEKARGQ